MSQRNVLQETHAPPVASGLYLTEEEIARVREQASHLVTEDDEPVDNLYSGRQQRLLVDSLYASWTPPPSAENPNRARVFLADANIGIFATINSNGIAPDVFVSLDIQINPDWIHTHHRSYFLWEHGKPPELVLEIVSNRKGGEMIRKQARYAAMGIKYYVVHDPYHILGERTLYVYELSGSHYRLRRENSLPDLGLRLTLSEERVENAPGTWLRWCDMSGNFLLTGEEKAKREAARTKRETARAKREAARAKQAEAQAKQAEAQAKQAEAQAKQEAAMRQQAEAENKRLMAKLRELGIDPQSF
jgi:Uma2 family endonuclease